MHIYQACTGLSLLGGKVPQVIHFLLIWMDLSQTSSQCFDVSPAFILKDGWDLELCVVWQLDGRAGNLLSKTDEKLSSSQVWCRPRSVLKLSSSRLGVSSLRCCCAHHVRQIRPRCLGLAQRSAPDAPARSGKAADYVGGVYKWS